MFCILLSLHVLAGCANLNSIYRDATLAKSSNGRMGLVTTDAKQRAILFTELLSVDGKRTDTFRMCAEQAPDVFSVISASLAASARYGQKADGELTAEGQLAAAISENAATIQRSQAINLIQTSMFRTCERFLNGAIDGEQLKQQALRDSNNMLAFLAIEQLTTFGRAPQPVVLTSNATQANTPAVSEAGLTGAKEKRDEAHKKIKPADDEYKVALGQAKDCDALADDNLKKVCKDKKQAALDRQKQFDDADALYNGLLALSNNSTRATTQQSGGTTIIQYLPPESKAITDVADAVKDIAIRAMIISACAEVGGQYRPERASSTVGDCIQAMGNMGQLRADKPNAAVTASIDAAIQDTPAFKALPRDAPNKSPIPVADAKATVSGKLWIQVAREAQRESAAAIGKKLDGAFSQLDVFGVELVEASPDQTQIRFFVNNAAEQRNAEFLAAAVAELIKTPVTPLFISGYNVGAGRYELWFGANTSLPTVSN
jgi:hypothetical protein